MDYRSSQSFVMIEIFVAILAEKCALKNILMNIDVKNAIMIFAIHALDYYKGIHYLSLNELNIIINRYCYYILRRSKKINQSLMELISELKSINSINYILIFFERERE